VSYKLTRLISPKNKVNELCEYIFKELNKYYDYTFLKLRNLTKNPIKLRKLRNQLSMRTCDELKHRFISYPVFRGQPKAIVKAEKIELINEQR